jgi:hypothetical protein
LLRLNQSAWRWYIPSGTPHQRDVFQRKAARRMWRVSHEQRAIGRHLCSLAGDATAIAACYNHPLWRDHSALPVLRQRQARGAAFSVVRRCQCGETHVESVQGAR